jgi:hypothetical protein
VLEAKLLMTDATLTSLHGRQSRSALPAENLFLRKQLALFQERKSNHDSQTTPPDGSW